MKAGLIEHIRTFVRAAETGSFTQVASEQGQSQPTVSRQVSALEEHLGVRLMQRTTRSLSLTEEGRAYLAYAHDVLDTVDQAAEAVRPGTGRVSGQLHIAAPLAFTRLHLFPILQPFLAAHPDLRTDWIVDDRPIDLIEAGVDVAIRIGEITDQTLITRRIGKTRRRLLASPDYLAGRQRPKTPSDLLTHDCIIFTGLATRNAWSFSSPSLGTETVKVSGRVHVSASEAVRSAVLGGFGIALCPTWLFADEIETGELIPLLTEYEPTSLPIQAVMPSRRMVTPCVRAFVDYVSAAFRSHPSLAPEQKV